MIREYERTPRRLFLAGVFGCYQCHLLKVSWFGASDPYFEREVLNLIEPGDTDDSVRARGYFGLAEGDGMLDLKFNVGISISVLKDSGMGIELFRSVWVGSSFYSPELVTLGGR